MSPLSRNPRDATIQLHDIQRWGRCRGSLRGRSHGRHVHRPSLDRWLALTGIWFGWVLLCPPVRDGRPATWLWSGPESMSRPTSCQLWLASARADEAMIEGCLKAAAELHHVPAGGAGAAHSVEVGRLGEVSQNANGTVDIGPMQVNDTWVPKIAGHLGASHDAAYRALRDNFCANVEGGAWILRQALDEAHGDLWKGVALYHSHDPVHKLEYMRLVYAQAMRLKRESRGSWQAPISMGKDADHGAVSPRSGRDRQRRLYRLQPDPHLRRARDPRLDGMEDVACGNQRGRAHRRPSRDAGDRMGFGSLLSGRHRGPARRSGRRPVQRSRAALPQYRDRIPLFGDGARSRARGFMFLSGRECPVHAGL